MVFHSAFKRKGMLTHAVTWMNPADRLSEISQS